MIINDLHIFVKFLKNQGQNIYHTPEQLDEVINRACLDLFRQEEKIFEAQQIITDTLGAFKVKYSPTLQVSGTYALPTNYIRMTNLAFDIDTVTKYPISTTESFIYCDNLYAEPTNTANDLSNLEHPIKLLVDSEWINRQRSSFLAPTVNSPIARIYGRNIEVLPKSIAPIIYYLRRPAKAVYGYTISSDGYSTIFNSATSTDIDFPEISHNEIIEKTLSLLGIPVRDSLLTQFEKIQKSNNNER